MKATLRIALLWPLLSCGCLGATTVLPEDRALYELDLGDGTIADDPTPSQVASHWGEPAERRREGDQEIWLYAREREWVGAVVWAVVPVPLLLPVSRREVELRFSGGRFVSVREHAAEPHSAFCGLAVGMCSAPGCYRD